MVNMLSSEIWLDITQYACKLFFYELTLSPIVLALKLKVSTEYQVLNPAYLSLTVNKWKREIYIL